MINIVVYGKPRAFESHDFCFEDKDGSTFTDNSFPEPSLKPKHFGEYVIHYFSKNGYAGVECYNRAKGYECERDGIVFGIALKTDHDFSITKVIENILKPYWSDFASALLNDEDRFIRPTILEILNGTKWDKNDADNIKGSIEASSSHVPTKNMCLLYLPDLDQIPKIESQLKDFKDVYISANLDIFKDSINKVVLNQTQGQICTVENGTIVEIKKDSIKDTDTRTGKKMFGWSTKRTSYSKDGNDDNGGKGGSENDNSTWKTKTVAIAVTIAVIVVALIVILKPWKSPNEPGEGSGGPVAPGDCCKVSFKEYDEPIKEKLDLDPQFVGDHGAVVMNDIEFSVDNIEYVEIEKREDDGHYILKVNNHPEKGLIVITVDAYYNGGNVGRQRYKIAAKDKTGTGTNGGNVSNIKHKNPKINKKTIEQYLIDLKNDLKNDSNEWVSNECDKIIKGDYDEKYKQEAKIMKEKAQKKLERALPKF